MFLKQTNKKAGGVWKSTNTSGLGNCVKSKIVKVLKSKSVKLDILMFSHF